MSEINRRHFLAAGAGVALLPAAVAASSSQDDRSHLHMEWHGVFGEGVPVHVAGRGFNGECYELSFV